MIVVESANDSRYSAKVVHFECLGNLVDKSPILDKNNKEIKQSILF